MPHEVTVHFPKGSFPGKDTTRQPAYKHGVVSNSTHPAIREGTQVEYHLDRTEGEDVLRVDERDEYRVTLDDGYEVDERDGSSMRLTVLDDTPWRSVQKRNHIGGDEHRK